MLGARFDRVVVRREGLRRPFPLDFAARLSGRTLRALDRRGKYLLGDLSSGETLLAHLGMSGSFRVEHAADPGTTPAIIPHDHVVFQMSSGARITFNDPRRFGVIDLIAPGQLTSHAAVGVLGPEPLSPAFDADALAHGCAGRRIPLKVALLDQRIVAGLGNIYASDALHLARLSPRRAAGHIATPLGRPRAAAIRLAAAIKTVLRRAIARSSTVRYREARFRVYDRDGDRCVTPGCGGTIQRFWQAGRSTFHCPVCQRS